MVVSSLGLALLLSTSGYLGGWFGNRPMHPERPSPPVDVPKHEAESGKSKAGETIVDKVPITPPIPAPAPTPKPAPKPLNTEQVVEKTEASVALLKGNYGSGSGFLVRPGLVATNAHVIRREALPNLEVYFPSATDGQKGPSGASLAYEDSRRDIAVLKVKTTLPSLEIASDHRFKRGEEITIIGNPGVKFIRNVIPNAVSRGVLSGEIIWRGFHYYQLGASVNHGNSGGPVLDSSGKVLGVVTLKAQEEAIGFCIPSSDLLSALAAMDAYSPEDVKRANKKHDVVAAVSLLREISALYCRGLEAYIDQMEKSLRRGIPPNEGLQGLAQFIAQALRAKDLEISDGLKAQLSKAVQDPDLAVDIRRNLRELWAAYSDMKSYVEEPRGTYESFRAKFLQLKDQNNHAVRDLELTLDLEPVD
jgi:S1-C subfamily serine protease